MQNSSKITVIFLGIFLINIINSSAQPVEYRDIIINEIMADPSPVKGLPEKEFIEIFNRSNKTIDYSNWTIKDASTTKGIFPSGSLAPGSYAIICKESDASLFAGYGTVIGVSSWPSLNNDKDSVVIRTNTLELVDAVYYSDSWYGDILKKQGGYSLELINPSLNCSNANNWIAAVSDLGGTPGYANSVLENLPDLKSPEILSYSIFSPNEVKIVFTESVDIVTATNPLLYLFSPSTLNVQSVSFNSNNDIATLLLSTDLVSGESYSLQIFGINDCEGNIMTDTILNVILGEAARYNDIIITEIMADPSPIVQLPEAEYVEIYNRSSKAINLEGIQFSVDSKVSILPNVQLEANSYALLTSSASSSLFSAPKVIGLGNFPTLTNSGASLALKNSNGNLIFQINYSDTWYASAAKKEGGWSLEMIDISQPCIGRENWKESSDIKGGTPGQKNSVQGELSEPLSLKPIAIEYLSKNVIQVNFSGKFHLDMLDKAQILVSPDMAINSIVPILPAADKLEISFQNDFSSGTVYEIAISQFYDCSGNESVATTLKFGEPTAAEKGDIIINELMYDPNTGGEDFVEILNISDKILSLSELILAREDVLGTKISIVKLEGSKRLFFPGEYIVLSAKGESIRNQYQTPGVAPFVDVAGFPNFINEGGVVALYRSDYEELDKLAYDSKMHFQLLDITKGVSLERVNPKVSSEERSNWNSAAISIGGATPGYENSQYLKAISHGTLNVSPEVISPDNDGIDDLLGVNYQLKQTGFVGSASIYTIEGIPVRKLFTQQTLAQEGFFTWNGLDDNNVKARVGIYLIVLEIFDLNGDKEILKKKFVVASKSH
ncbi:MAG: lamin tail domain-containing protein [Chitinophagales bacterium]|nr:lamin tail domain-containing protein [Chitinophagales bacterium]